MKIAKSKMLIIFLLAYTAASVFHFTHNAVFLDIYPNMPNWISQLEVYSALLVVVAIGSVGFLLYILGYRAVGLIVLGVYAALGFDGLAHYSLAPIASHTFTMNFTIWLEVVTAALLLVVVVIQLGNYFSTKTRSDA